MPFLLAPYRAVLALPGALAFSAAGFVARIPMSMSSLGIVLLIEGARGSYGLAGAVAGTWGLCGAFAAPQLSRLVDRLGQARVLRPAVLVNASALVALVVVTVVGAPVALLFLAAAVGGGSSVSTGSLVRARWSHALGAGPRLHTAYSLESALDELVFIVGPLLITVLATRVAPAAGLLLAAAVMLSGALALAAQRRTEPPVRARDGVVGGTVLRAPGLVVLFATFLLAGGIFGSAEVAVVAFTEQLGSAGAAGVVLALWALGSMLAGLGYGAVQWRSAPGRRFLVAIGLLAAGTVPMALAGSVPMLALVMFVAGFAISPAIIAGYALVGSLVHEARLTEGLTWATTGINIGYSAFAAVAGVTIDAYGAPRAFLVTVACGLGAGAIAVSGARWLQAGRDMEAGATLASAHDQ